MRRIRQAGAGLPREKRERTAACPSTVRPGHAESKRPPTVCSEHEKGTRKAHRETKNFLMGFFFLYESFLVFPLPASKWAAANPQSQWRKPPPFSLHNTAKHLAISSISVNQIYSPARQTVSVQPPLDGVSGN